MSDAILLAIAAAVSGAAIGYIGGPMSGYAHGVKDTESRWSEAVSRANHQRESMGSAL